MATAKSSGGATPSGKPASKKEKDADRRNEAAEAHPHATRETIESIVVAVILAFLLRSFLVEPFVIPTGSMASTLQGSHRDVVCAECGRSYRVGASSENDDRHESQEDSKRSQENSKRIVVGTVCPNCRYPMALDPNKDANQKTFNGDRIVVSKFAYELSEPERWDVIVFKYPGDARDNYIKRLVGLPNETVWLYCGDVYVKKPGDEDYQIARKPDHRLLSMLQLVHDSRFVSVPLRNAGWPDRWRAWSPTGPVAEEAAKPLDEGRRYSLNAPAGRETWLRYDHTVPELGDWEELRRTKAIVDAAIRGPQLITDYYEYNSQITVPEHASYSPGTPLFEYAETNGQIVLGSASGSERLLDYPGSDCWGMHWVGDLALEADIEVQGGTGAVLLDLVEGGLHHRCRIELADGAATLAIDDGRLPFDGPDGTTSPQRTAKTTIRGPGKHSVRFSNVDDELRLWIDGGRVEFDGPTTFRGVRGSEPKWSPDDPGDLAPLGVGGDGVELELSRLRVLRDIYYIAYLGGGLMNDYDPPTGRLPEETIGEIFFSPEVWRETDLFKRRRKDVIVQLAEGQYMPLGDNSPQSADARSWPATANGEPFVERDMLLGRAILIYWPHGWNRPIPFWPNVPRMGRIR